MPCSPLVIFVSALGSLLTEKTLRFEYPKNGQKQGITLAKDYELEIQLQKVKEEVAEH